MITELWSKAEKRKKRVLALLWHPTTNPPCTTESAMPMAQEVPETAGAAQPLPEDTIHCFQLQRLAMRTIFHMSPSIG